MAKVIEAVQMPTLIMTHNKTLAAQLYSEFRGFFPDNHVEYFISYYDYYQPEAYRHNGFDDTRAAQSSVYNGLVDIYKFVELVQAAYMQLQVGFTDFITDFFDKK